MKMTEKIERRMKSSYLEKSPGEKKAKVSEFQQAFMKQLEKWMVNGE